MREDLAEKVRRVALLEGDFVLSSGRRSSYYIDKYLFSTDPELLREISAELAEHIPSQARKLAGVELGAVPLVVGVSLASGLPYVIVRKEHKEYGTGKGVEGTLKPREKVVLIEDVISTGAQAVAAAERLCEMGAEVLKVVAVLDRRDEKTEKIGKFPLESLFSVEDIGVRGEN